MILRLAWQHMRKRIERRGADALRVLFAVLAVLGSPAVAQEDGAAPAPAAAANSVCDLIETAANAHGLPVGFFTRLIWRESAFRPDVVSYKGAQGIAQFMPGTASERGLADPFDPQHAIPASASYLRDLADQFGNLGLAAAAYNAGADRVSRWLAGASVLPAETEAYVAAVTGRAASSFMAGKDAPALTVGLETDCDAVTADLRLPRAAPGIETARMTPWGVQVAGNFSREKALQSYSALQKKFPQLLGGQSPIVRAAVMRSMGTRPIYQIRVPAQTREAANSICQKLSAAGGACVVMKN
jgi:hypothetical protein